MMSIPLRPLVTTARHPRRRAAVTVIIVLCLAGLYVALWSLIGQKAKRLHDQESREQQTAHVTALNRTVREQLATHAAALKQLKLVTPAQPELSTVVGRIETLADQASVKLSIKSITNNPATTTTDVLVTSSLSLEATGSPAALLTWLAAIEHLTELTMVSPVALVSLPAAIPDVDSPTHRLTLTMLAVLRAS